MAIRQTWDIWSHTADHARRCACLFDFDGTLAPILDDPSAVSPVEGAVPALAELAGLVHTVAIVSARPVDFLNEHFKDLPDISLFGLYGAEWRDRNGSVCAHPEFQAYETTMGDLAARARAELPQEVFVEYKRLSVALHYRNAQGLRALVEQWSEATASAMGLRIQAGRMVVELKPPGDHDKGHVVSDLVRDVSCAWYFGDDLSDLRAFAALDARGADDPSFRGVKVCVANPESGQSLSEKADLHLDSPECVPETLSKIISSITATGSRSA